MLCAIHLDGVFTVAALSFRKAPLVSK